MLQRLLSFFYRADIHIIVKKVYDEGCRMNIACFREKSAMIKQLEDRLKEQGRQAQIAIEDFKMQAEETSRKTFQDMKQQV